jgi:hypothetical protein
MSLSPSSSSSLSSPHFSSDFLLNLPPTPSELLNCSICYQDLFQSELQCSSSPICLLCVKGFLRDQIIQSKIDQNGSIRCPCITLNCPNIITSKQILNFIQNDSDLQFKYLKFWNNKKVDSDPTLIWCPKPNCEGIAKLTKKNKAICENCNFQFCSICRVQHSAWQFCSTDGVKKWKSSHRGVCKKCPKCRYHIEKNGGCNHMTCSACKHEFCWLCKSDYIHGCTAGRLCWIIAFNKFQHWGQNTSTRAITKTVAYPILAGVALGGVGVGLGVAAVGAVTVLPYMGLKKMYRDRRNALYNHETQMYQEGRDFPDIFLDDLPVQGYRHIQNVNRIMVDFDDLQLPRLFAHPLPVPSNEFVEIPSNLYERYCTYRRYQFSLEMIYHRFHYADRINITHEQIQEYSERFSMVLEDLCDLR